MRYHLFSFQLFLQNSTDPFMILDDNTIEPSEGSLVFHMDFEEPGHYLFVITDMQGDQALFNLGYISKPSDFVAALADLPVIYNEFDFSLLHPSQVFSTVMMPPVPNDAGFPHLVL